MIRKNVGPKIESWGTAVLVYLHKNSHLVQTKVVTKKSFYLSRVCWTFPKLLFICFIFVAIVFYFCFHVTIIFTVKLQCVPCFEKKKFK